MSTVTIKSGDNIQSRISGSSTGDNIVFDGDFSIATVSFLGGRDYGQTANSRLTGIAQANPNITIIGTSDVVVDGLYLVNANMKIEKCSRVYVRSKFQGLRNRSGSNSHVINANMLTDCEVTGEFIDQVGAGVDTSIYGFDCRRTKFNGGRFTNVHEGIHITWYASDPNNPWDCEFTDNIIVGIQRHGIELQRFAYGCYVRRNHISGRTANGIGLSIATGADGGYNGTANIEVDDNVVDNTGFPVPDYSQCVGIEIMGRFKVRRNVLVNAGQGIAYTYNPTDSIIAGNRFKDMPEAHYIVTDVPHDRAVTPQMIDNVATSGVPTAAETVKPTVFHGGTVPPDPPPVSNMKVTPVAYTSFVRVQCEGTNSGNTVLQWRGGDGIWKDDSHKITTLPVTIDVGFDAAKYKNWWLWFRLLDAVAPSPETKTNVQLGTTADPSPIPPPPIKLVSTTQNIKRDDGTTATYDVPIENGVANYNKATVK